MIGKCFENNNFIGEHAIRGLVIIPKSTHIDRMKENLAALDFELTADEMGAIEQLEIGRSLFGWW